MRVSRLPLFEKGIGFTPIFQAYIEQEEKLKPFYGLYPDTENFLKQAEAKSFTSEARIRLQDVLQTQYKDLTISEAVSQNLDLLAEGHTYTVTTGHQLNIFTGPLYFIYKIVTVINLAAELNEKYPDKHFVPVYWMASEDHDFEEISHFNLFGQEYRWNNGGQQGAVGRMDTKGIESILNELPEAVPVFEKAYTSYNNLADATRYFVNELFGEEGLIVVDADSRILKESFASVIKDDLTNHSAKACVEETSARLDEMGYKTQIFPREINFFYLKEGLRERIEATDEGVKVLNTEFTFSKEELAQEIDSYPERFSPNVVMRPLYQEVILPNIAYIGGPSEVAYWLQLKDMFDHYEVPFPIVMPRNFGLVVNKTNAKKLRKLPVSTEDLFRPFHELKEEALHELSENELSLETERNVGKQIYESIFHKAAEVDPSLKGFVGSEENKFLKSLENIEKRLKKAEEKRLDTSMNQLEKLKDKLFPENTWQERYDNFLNVHLNSPEFISVLLEEMNPLDFRMHVMIEDHD
ncbi:bacillithiol biosynthesis cysteine-adding enzyme BshC [Roseivirga sp. BDSF3-8]|uniref:bacillithiol biosynthesis cysteine-adding enzyme BshC n=1 Tax=Roseivirga sp. BDSF3-8 TaxID=3241598 RepID=UPI00353240B7